MNYRSALSALSLGRLAKRNTVRLASFSPDTRSGLTLPKRHVFLLLGILLSGCSTFTPPARDHEIVKDKLTWVDFAADRRGAWILSSATDPSRVKVCAEPFPDAANNFNGAGSGGHAGASVQFSADQTTVELSGRSSSVLALRESLYRICELNMMGALSPQDTKELFEKTLNSLQLVAQTEVAASPAANIIHDLNAAHKYEAAGFDALLDSKWDEAQTAFEKSEQAYPTFHGSYEFALALKQTKGKPDKERAKAVLEKRAADYLPRTVKTHLESFK